LTPARPWLSLHQSWATFPPTPGTLHDPRRVIPAAAHRFQLCASIHLVRRVQRFVDFPSREWLRVLDGTPPAGKFLTLLRPGCHVRLGGLVLDADHAVLSARKAVFSTPHFCAAAWTSMSARRPHRPFRMDPRTPHHSICRPCPSIERVLKYSLPRERIRWANLLSAIALQLSRQSANRLWMPWPFPDLFMMMVRSSVPMRIHAFSAAGSAVPAGLPASAHTSRR